MTRPYRRLLAALVSALAGLTLALTPAGSAHAAHGQAFLDPGETLLPGQYLVAGNYRLVMQRDGNLVYYRHYGTSSQRACAASHTTAHPGSRAWMSPNGTFSVYTPE